MNPSLLLRVKSELPAFGGGWNAGVFSECSLPTRPHSCIYIWTSLIGEDFLPARKSRIAKEGAP
jgi:hypothetical protein